MSQALPGACEHSFGRDRGPFSGNIDAGALSG